MISVAKMWRHDDISGRFPVEREGGPRGRILRYLQSSKEERLRYLQSSKEGIRMPRYHTEEDAPKEEYQAKEGHFDAGW